VGAKVNSEVRIQKSELPGVYAMSGVQTERQPDTIELNGK
jgi:hypothetical protein